MNPSARLRLGGGPMVACALIAASGAACASSKAPARMPIEQPAELGACDESSECHFVVVSCSRDALACDAKGAVWVVNTHHRADAEREVRERCGGDGRCTAYPAEDSRRVPKCEHARCAVGLELLDPSPKIEFDDAPSANP